jgi:hypothetical protein
MESKAHQKDFLSLLREMAFRSLQRMYLPEERLFVFRLRKDDHRIISEGISRRYTAITLIGLAEEEQADVERVLSGHSLFEIGDRLRKDVSEMHSLGDVALTLWSAIAIGYDDRNEMWRRLHSLKPIDQPHPVVDLSWTLDALCRERDPSQEGFIDQVAERLLSSFHSGSAVFSHMVDDRLQAGGARAHVSCFADMVYPIHALSRYFLRSGNPKALEAATQCAERICRLQGRDGQWWWHYDRRTGDVLEGYPVYAIHQDAMAPMALFALQEAGGPDFTREIQRGLQWLEHSPEIDASLVDLQADLIWRKVGRREPGKLTRYAHTTASKVHPSLRMPMVNRLFPPVKVDCEDRPYHLGWMFYAWPKDRVHSWRSRQGDAP